MKRKKASELKKGDKVMLDGNLCNIISIELSALGKHGAKKCRIVASDVSSGEMKVVIKPADILLEIE